MWKIEYIRPPHRKQIGHARSSSQATVARSIMGVEDIWFEVPDGLVHRSSSEKVADLGYEPALALRRRDACGIGTYAVPFGPVVAWRIETEDAQRNTLSGQRFTPSPSVG